MMRRTAFPEDMKPPWSDFVSPKLELERVLTGIPYGT
jgi:hypothetical protein